MGIPMQTRQRFAELTADFDYGAKIPHLSLRKQWISSALRAPLNCLPEDTHYLIPDIDMSVQ